MPIVAPSIDLLTTFTSCLRQARASKMVRSSTLDVLILLLRPRWQHAWGTQWNLDVFSLLISFISFWFVSPSSCLS